MVTLLIISVLLNIVLAYLCLFYRDLYNKQYNSSKYLYPSYYKLVSIEYKLPGKLTQTAKAWLSVNDDLDKIWTLEDNQTIIPDEYVTWWKVI